MEHNNRSMSIRSILPAIAISLAVVMGTWLLAKTWRATHDVFQKISVTGVAQQNFESDRIVWQASFERRGTQINEAYALMKSDADVVRNYLLAHGIAAKEFVFDAVNIERETKMVMVDNRSREEFVGYRLSQSLRVESNNLDKVEKLSREISELLKGGMQLTSNNPSYYYSNLSTVKANLLSAASHEGRERAQTIATNSGGKIGSLRKAEMGIFQITGQNSNDDYSWSGAFNTTSRFKTASVTVKMEFDVE